VVGLLIATSLVLPHFRYAEGNEVARRFSFAVVALRGRAVLGPDPAIDDLRAVQERAPEGARIAFWGQSAARLDFARNPIRDVSFATRTSFLDPIAPRRLDGIEFVLLEDILPAPRTARRREPVWEPALGEVAELLEPAAAIGVARLYRVRGGDR
jgi:hypothetical protein